MRTFFLIAVIVVALLIGGGAFYGSCQPERVLTRAFNARFVDAQTSKEIYNARVTITTAEPRVSLSSEPKKYGPGYVPALTVKQCGCFNFRGYAPFMIHVEADGYAPTDIFLDAGDDTFYLPQVFPIRREQVIPLHRKESVTFYGSEPR